ncbi:MAG TPA: alpha/beta fold hydrolase [Thermoanaerobaculia bacterium]|nr:alpha/beta fold hydrolase [Thermoanaerobaculia bacterium]
MNTLGSHFLHPGATPRRDGTMPGVTEEFEVSSTEGLPIRGTIDVPPDACGLVVVIHGFKGFRNWGFFPWVSEQLVARGIAACRFDMSRNGVGSTGDRFDRLDLFENDTCSIQLADLRRVIDHLLERGEGERHPIFLLGHSRGGALALLAAQGVRNLRGVVTWSAISGVDRWDETMKEQWRATGFVTVVNQRTGQQMRMSRAILEDYEGNRERFDVVRAAEHLDVPLLVIHGSRDESVPVDDARRIAGRNQNASLVVIEGGSHTFGAIHPLVTVPRELQLATGMTIRFVEMHR